MREIRQSGSEGGAGYIPVPTPIKVHAKLTDPGAWVDAPAGRAGSLPQAADLPPVLLEHDGGRRAAIGG